MDNAAFAVEWDRFADSYNEPKVLSCIPAVFKGARVRVNGAVCCWCVRAAREWLEPGDTKEAQATCWASALEACHSALHLHVLLKLLENLEVAGTIARSKVNRVTFLLDATTPTDH